MEKKHFCEGCKKSFENREVILKLPEDNKNYHSIYEVGQEFFPSDCANKYLLESSGYVSGKIKYFMKEIFIL